MTWKLLSIFNYAKHSASIFIVIVYKVCVKFHVDSIKLWGGGAEEGTVPVILLLPTVSQNMHGDNVHVTYPGL